MHECMIADGNTHDNAKHSSSARLSLTDDILTGDARPRFFESVRFARGAGAARAKRER